MNISKITGALALTMAVSALPAMAINTSGRAYGYNDPNQNRSQNQNSRFKGMDRNGDGVITRDEWRGNDKSFDKHDRDRDGVISAADQQFTKQGHGKKAKKQHRGDEGEDDRENDRD